jgi:hypothetical protein
MTPDRLAAFRRERADVLAFCRDLDTAEWQWDSAAHGWRVQDVLAHMGSGCRVLVLFGPATLKVMRSNDIEHTNDDFVDVRREWPAARVFAEYERWSRMVIGMMGAVSRTPLARAPMRLAELGRFATGQIVSAMVFDHHTHLRHDIAPALNRPIPGTDAARMSVVLEWMMAVLSNELRAARPAWLDRPLSISLTGAGGGCWTVGADGSVTPGTTDGAAAQIEATALEFPEWGTKRADWRARQVQVRGDAAYGGRFLDAVNVV